MVILVLSLGSLFFPSLLCFNSGFGLLLWQLWFPTRTFPWSYTPLALPYCMAFLAFSVDFDHPVALFFGLAQSSRFSGWWHLIHN